MIIYIVGNALVDADSLPLRLKQKLQKAFPDFQFIEVDPTENFIPEEDSVIIDTVIGIKKITLFDSIDAFVDAPRISPHDYDLGFHLKLMQKLHKINRLTILGIPQGMDEKKALRHLHLIFKKWVAQLMQGSKARMTRSIP